ncbi:sodium:dicarboxylate symporter [Caballeronia hypogeia]|uniref:Sodium:dicarboxylate symporter n=1 Tax=Caballeronia hypogeia TaxID=1777140 RepID=A0A157ZKK6_9BURK|nr:C4-dicarboxylate transporter DctA [Caballeronia hypogeia]SAK46050.1 sodium:dicarboxylate symporter [Caballeronia hypogeia]
MERNASDGAVHARDAEGKGARKRPHFCSRLYVQVIFAIFAGALVGYLYPKFGTSLKPLGDVFVKGIKMVVAPIIFTTVVCGIAKMGNLKRVANIGVKSLIYFEVVSTIALLLGWFGADMVRPGDGINANPASFDPALVAGYVKTAHQMSITDFLMSIVPSSMFDAFAKGEMLPVLFVSVMFGIALSAINERAQPVIDLLDSFSKVFFAMVKIVMYFAPLAAFGAMGFTVGAYGIASLAKFSLLLGTVFVVSVAFVVVVLGLLLAACGLSLRKVLRFFRDEILVVFGSTSAETMIPRIMVKLERLGCTKDVVGLVIPTGYSFNMDGTAIYMSIGVLFIAQACNIDLSLTQQMTILFVMLLTSKGAAGVTGGGFIALAATLPVIGVLPVGGLALLIGVDRFMAQIRAATNLTGNVIGTIVIARWTGTLDVELARRVLNGDEDDGRPSRSTMPEGALASAHSMNVRSGVNA